MKNIKLLDSTLREGAQSPGVSYTSKERLEIATALDEFEIDFIELGHPAVSDSVFEGVREVSSQNLDASLLAHSRATKEDIDLVIESGVEWIGIFLCVSERALKNRFEISLDEALQKIERSITYAKDHGLKVRFTPEDTIRTEWDNLFRTLSRAKDAGANRFSVADTTGSAYPFDFYQIVTDFLDYSIPTNVHCHDDMGLALTNAIMGVEAGATLVDASVNGIGERSGIVDLAQIAVTLKYHYDIDAYNLHKLNELSEMIQNITGLKVQENQPIVGENAFVHNSGLHVSAVIEDPNTYEFMPAEDLGRKREVHLDMYSGKDSVKHYLEKKGIKADDKTVKKILASLKSSSGQFDLKKLISKREIKEEKYVDNS